MKPEHKVLFNKLTRLQKGVCLGVLEGKKHAPAYFDAGGVAKSEESAKTIVGRMLKHDADVVAFMDAVEEEAISSTVMTKREALERLSRIASTPISEIVDSRTGKIRQGVTDEELSALCEISVSKAGEIKYKAHSAIAAINDLAKMLGWNAPTKIAETDTDGNDKDIADREVARRIAFALSKAVQDTDE